jgi:hypothetical protein
MNDRNDSNRRDDSRTGPSRSDPLPEARALTENGQIIDRLVAGDLDEVRRREVLAWLDEKPGRWRHCGLAFLEAQLWQESFSGAVSRSETLVPTLCVGTQAQDAPRPFESTQSVAPGRSHAERENEDSEEYLASSARDASSPRPLLLAGGSQTRPQAPAHRAWPSVRNLTAVAAAMLVAFGLGSLTGSAWPWSVIRDGESAPWAKHVTDSTSDRTGQVTSNTAAGDAHSPKGIASATIEMAQDHPRSSPVQTFAVLKVATEDADTREIHLPVLEGPASNERWLRPDPEALPEYVQRQLERHGYQLQQRRRFLKVQLEDGRDAVIPVDQYQLKFVASQSS